MQGYIEIYDNRMMLPSLLDENCYQACPFGYLLALTYLSTQKPLETFPKPTLDRTANLRTDLLNTIQNKSSSQANSKFNFNFKPGSHSTSKLAALQKSRSWMISDWSYATVGVPWFQPILDFSIPPDRIYQRIAAWRVLDQKQPLILPNLSQQIVMIMAGGYASAGGIGGDPDYLPNLPAAVSYWRDRLPPDNHAANFPNGNSKNQPTYLPRFPGGEIHAYTIHHMLNQRMVIPIPDLWMVAITGLLTKFILLQFNYQERQQRKSYLNPWKPPTSFVIATAIYTTLSLQLYVSAAILLPLALPLLTFWLYVLTLLRRKPHG